MSDDKETVGTQRSHEDPHEIFPDIPNACPECRSPLVVPCDEIWMYECPECGDGPRHVQPEDDHV